MNGLHLTADLRGCNPVAPVMTDRHALRELCLSAVAQAGLQAVGECFHQFPRTEAPTGISGSGSPDAPPCLSRIDRSEANEWSHPPTSGGVTGVVLLAESHLAIHTWPEQGAVTLDAYVCNLHQDNRERAENLFQHLLRVFAPTHTTAHRLTRGDLREPEINPAHVSA